MILHLITSIEPAGAQKILSSLISSKDHRNDAIIYFFRTPAYLQDLLFRDNLYYLQYPKTIFSIPFFLFSYFKLLRKIKPLIIHSSLYHADSLTLFNFIFFRIPIVWSVHNGDTDSLGFTSNILLRLLAILSHYVPSVIIYCSHYSRNKHESLGYCRDLGLVIHNGYDSSLYSFSLTDRFDIRTSLSLDPHQYVIGFFSRFSPVKDIPCIINAFNHHLNNSCLIFFGTKLFLGYSF